MCATLGRGTKTLGKSVIEAPAAMAFLFTAQMLEVLDFASFGTPDGSDSHTVRVVGGIMIATALLQWVLISEALLLPGRVVDRNGSALAA